MTGLLFLVVQLSDAARRILGMWCARLPLVPEERWIALEHQLLNALLASLLGASGDDISLRTKDE